MGHKNEATYIYGYFLTCTCGVKEGTEWSHKQVCIFYHDNTKRWSDVKQNPSNYKQAVTFTTVHIHYLFQNALETNKMAATNIWPSIKTT